MPGLIHVPDDESLKFLTSPKHPKFLQDAFDSHLYCSSTDKFFKFDEVSYYKGLQTIAARESVYSSSQIAGVFSESMGVCAHWPSRASLTRAGMIHNTFKDLRRNFDCPYKDNHESECVQGKRIKSESLSLSDQASTSSSSKRSVQPSVQVAQAETLSIQLEAAHEQIRLLKKLHELKDELIEQLKKNQRVE